MNYQAVDLHCDADDGDDEDDNNANASVDEGGGPIGDALRHAVLQLLLVNAAQVDERRQRSKYFLKLFLQ